MAKATGKAHGKLILIGEHSVVYDKLSVGIPFMAVNVISKLEESTDETYLDSEVFTGPIHKVPSYLENIYSLYKKLKADHNISSQNFHISIKSTIPMERGLGSSAAIAVSLIRAFENYIGEKFSDEQFLEYVDHAEKISHGNPSGLDARIISFEKPLLYQKSKPIQSFYFDTPYWLVVVDTGITGQTKDAVSDVRASFDSPYYARFYATRKTINNLDRLAHEFHHTLSNETDNFNRLADIINNSQNELRTLQVSSPEQDNGIRFARENGAAAGKLTGGGRGGCFYLLVESEYEANILKNKMLNNDLGVDAWTIPLSSMDMGKDI